MTARRSLSAAAGPPSYAAGKKKGRQGDEITIFDSTGLALQDVALARALYEAARTKGVGTPFDLVGS